MKSTTLCHRVGFGFDSHLYSDRGSLVLGGVRFKNLPSLAGHSDGDALLHAVIDALLGGAGLADIGTFFPDTAKRTKGISSGIMLKQVIRKIYRRGLEPAQLDVTILAKQPKIAVARTKLQSSLSRLLGVPIDRIGLKGKTPEGLNFFSAPGVAVWVIVTLHEKR